MIVSDLRPQLLSSLEPMPTQVDAGDTDDISDSEDSSDEEYHSFESDSESEEKPQQQSEDEKRKEHEARALERERVLAAAGLIVKKEHGRPPPARPSRRKSVRKRRPPPETPKHQGGDRPGKSRRSEKDLPATPETVEPYSPAVEPIMHVDDAFERYETYRKTKDYRMSVSSIDSLTHFQSPVSPPPTLTPSVSRESESRGHSALFNFLGRKTPGSDTEKPRLQISAPILQTAATSESPSRENSPAFGMVSVLIMIMFRNEDIILTCYFAV